MSSVYLLKDRGKDKAGTVISVPFGVRGDLIKAGLARDAGPEDLQPRKPQAGLKELPKRAERAERPQQRPAATAHAPPAAEKPPVPAKEPAAPEAKESAPEAKESSPAATPPAPAAQAQGDKKK